MKRPISRSFLRSRLAASVCTLAMLASTCVLQAVTRTWDGGPGGTGTIMNTGTNWNLDVTPSAAADIAQWDATVAGDLSLTWDAAWGTNILVTSGHTGLLTMTGTSQLSFYNTFEVQSGAGAVSIGVDAGPFQVAFRGITAPVFTNSSTNTVTFGSNITSWVNGSAQARFVTFGGSGNWQIDGNYAPPNDGGGTGGDDLGGGLTKVGTGTLTLNGSQNGKLSTSFAGGNTLGSITISEGTLKFGAAAQMGSKAESSQAGTPGTYTGTIANNGTFEWASSAIQTLSGVISGTGALKQTGAGTLTLSGSTANTYSGLTTITLGGVDLSKTAGTDAIAGDGNTGTTDVTVNGGTLRWLQNNQIADTASIALSSGTVALNGKTETLYGFSNSGGIFTTGTGHLIGMGNTITWSGGTNTVNNGGLVEDAHIVISGGTNTIEGGATGGVLQLNAGGDGLEMSNGSTLTLNSDNAVAGKLILKGDVTTSGDTTVSISSGLALANKGTVDLDGGTRTFTVADGAAGTDLAISAVIANGGLTKDGTGTMSLSAANTYSGATTVTAGTLVLATGGSIANSTLVDLNAGATFDTTAQSFTMLGSQTFNFTIDATGSGSAGLLNAGTFDISAGVVTFNLIGTLDDSVYILANYSSLVGTEFASVTAPSGYMLNYNYGGGNQIALQMVIPEPNSVALLLGGLGILSIFRRRRA